MADDDSREPEKATDPELIAANWDVGKTDVVLEEDGIRVTIELTPRTAGAKSTKMEFFTRPF